MKILITGGAGFIGSHLTDALIEKGNEILIIDNLSSGKMENVNPKAEFYKLDIQSPEISEIFKKNKPEAVFHLAAMIDVRKSVEDPAKDAETNILGSLNVLENCRKNGVEKIIFASTGGAIYGDADIIPTPESYPEFPLSPYGIAKLTIEKYLNYYHKIFGLSFVALRLSNVYGPRQNSEGESGVVAIFCDKIFLGRQPVINGDGEQTRDYVFVDDVVEANILALEKDKIGVFNVGTGKETSVNEVFKKLKNLSKTEIKGIYGPAMKGEQKRSCLDFSKIEKELGWTPKYDLERGLAETISSH